MRRILLSAAATVAIVVLLFSYRTSTIGSGSGPVIGQEAPISSGSATTTGATGARSTQTFTGSAASTRYGPVQVEITTEGSRILTAAVVQYPDSDRRDAEINGRALPILTSQTIETQDGEVDMVSGATYTSDGYAQSLQSALDQAGL